MSEEKADTPLSDPEFDKYESFPRLAGSSNGIESGSSSHVGTPSPTAESDSRGKSSGYFAGSSASEVCDRALLLERISTKEECEVCQRIFTKDSILTVCEPCQMFFKTAVFSLATYYCTLLGKCSVAPLPDRKCDYCRLNKCYDAGLKAELQGQIYVYGTLENWPRLRPPRQIINEKSRREIWVFRHSLIVARQIALEWMADHQDIKDLDELSRVDITSKCEKRGTLIVLLVRSLHCQGVLRLYGSFFQPYQCNIESLSAFAGGMVNLIRSMWQSGNAYELTDRRIMESLTFMNDASFISSPNLIRRFGDHVENIVSLFDICREELFRGVFPS